MQIKLWKDFSKRANSTKQPNANPYSESNPDGYFLINVRLKENTSIENPTFILSGNDFSFNYAKAFNHYYYINDIISLHDGLTQINCTQDLLATYKSEINSTTAFVEYSASNYNLDITDNRVSARNDFDINKQTYTPSLVFDTTGCYILGVINDASNGIGGLGCYYAVGADTLQGLSNAVLSNDEILQQLINHWTNPKETIISCFWLPLTLNQIQGTGEVIKLGGQSAQGILGKKITSRIVGYTLENFNITWNTDERSYLDKAPFTTGLLYLPFVGVVPFDVDFWYKSLTFNLALQIDVLTGDLVYQIVRVGQISNYSGNCASSLPLSASSYNATGFVNGAVTAIGGVASIVAGAVTGGAGLIAGGVGALSAGGMASATSLQTHTSINGSNSSAVGVFLGTKPELLLVTRKPTESITAMRNVKGLCCFKTLALSSLSGYVKCSNAYVNMAGLANDRSQVNSLLNSGIYLE